MQDKQMSIQEVEELGAQAMQNDDLGEVTRDAIIIKLVLQLADSMSENERLRNVARRLLDSVQPCPSCDPTAECYVFSMVAFADVAAELEEIEARYKHLEEK